MTAVALAAATLAAATAQAQVMVNRRIAVQAAAPPDLPGGPGRANGPADQTHGERGLHIPQVNRVSFTHRATDGAGFLWDIQPYGNIGQGTNYAYGSGLYLQVDGRRAPSGGQGWINKAGDEIEVGPQTHGSLRISRRIKVYKDQALARWLDIFENSTPQNVTVQVQVQTYHNYGIGRTETSSGGAAFGQDDWAFITEPQGANNVPAVLHVVCDEKSSLRPSVVIQNNEVQVRYTVTVPARRTAVLCYFESQNSVDEHRKLLKSFRAQRLLRDLAPAVRKLILNIGGGAAFGDLELERTETADTVIRASGEPIYGAITDTHFSLEAFYGGLKIAAKDVVGMVVDPADPQAGRIALTDGQVVFGRMPAGKIHMKLPTGGDPLTIPIDGISQWSYRISTARPDEAPFAGPMIVLRTGDRLRFDGSALSLSLHTRHGKVELNANDLLEVVLDNPANAVHRAVFLNGSTLGGLLEPERIELPLALGPKLHVSRNMIARIALAGEEKPDELLAHLVLTNGNELIGRLTDPQIAIRTEYGEAAFKPANIQSMSFSPTCLGRAALTLWDGSVLRGQLIEPVLGFQIVPGPVLRIYAGQIVAVRRPQSSPPEQIIQEVERLVARLGAESYKDRQEASNALTKMGKGIVPLLGRHLQDSDPEVRHRIEDIVDHLGGAARPAEDPARNMPAELLER